MPQRVTDGDPNYLAKADYGKVPEYLGQVKEEIRRENQMIDAYVTELSGGRAEEKDSMELMDEGERQFAAGAEGEVGCSQQQVSAHVPPNQTGHNGKNKA